MHPNTVVVPLRIADEAFMVASTIERCPKTMMLRELVVNALEAARSATGAAPQVRISACSVGDAMKLRLWNTGRGLSPEELLKISDLSSSLFKTVALDGNFGMGAKVASLASNKFGLMYRSCQDGRVSQIVIGQRNGVYGRLRQSAPGVQGGLEVVDVTALCRAEGEHDLGHDWTEVILMGNTLDQDTVAAPYADNPPVAADWVMQSLSRRFFRLPEGVELRLDAAVAGVETVFAPPLGAAFFDRVERVVTPAGLILHYGFRAADSTRPMPAMNPVGLGAVISDGEVYALVEGRRWALEAPTYGFTFAARLCTVLIELPASFGAQPEVYRQFLRFQDGDQRQVHFADFAEAVRAHIPSWLKRIIDAMLPETEDYLQEIKADLQDLMQQLGITDASTPRPVPRGEVKPPPAKAAPRIEEATAPNDAKPSAPKPPPAPPRPRLPTPPEIIIVEDDDALAERGLAGRAARYYRASRQLFVNIRYAAFARLAAELEAEFAQAADQATIALLSHQVTEWVLIRRLTRNLIHSLGKQQMGWTAEEAAAVQTPECLSLLLDDYETLKPAARQRMARQLGMEPVGGGRDPSVGFVRPAALQNNDDAAADPSRRSAASSLGEQREATPLVASAEGLAAGPAPAEANPHRAKAIDGPKLSSFYRTLAKIEVRRKNFDAARAALENAIRREPHEAGLHHDLAGLRMTQGDLDGAASAAEAAVAHSAEAPVAAMRRLADIEVRRGNPSAAQQILRDAIACAPGDPWPYFDLAGLHMAQGETHAAAEQAEAALARATGQATRFLQRLAWIESRRHNMARAVQLLEQATRDAPDDAGAHLQLAQMHLAHGDLDGADAAAGIAHALTPTASINILRLRSVIAMRRKDHRTAQDVLVQAIAIAPDDAGLHLDLSKLLAEQGDLDGAATAAEAAIAHSAEAPVAAMRHFAEIEIRRGNPPSAQQVLRDAIARVPGDPWPYFDLAGLCMAQGQPDAALEQAEAALARATGRTTRFLQRLAWIESRRHNMARAVQLLEQAIRDAPDDAGAHLQLAQMRLAHGDLDGADAAAGTAHALTPNASVNILRLRSVIATRRKDYGTAHDVLVQAIAIAPDDAGLQLDLSKLRAELGGLAPGENVADPRRTGVLAG
ncbi:tetratricopeptide repeat protein [Humitalea sp. 24SJ18S-53]|uniref:tetratricopeptide repeat protein n=1 Tax=Humitalea sp. 24SJ18S-53 TaxID=3422307 RepID=UPI003D673736